NWRPIFDKEVVSRELGIIKRDLHCNAVRICGLDIDRLVTASEDALSQGLEVWLSPEMWDKGRDETVAYIERAAERSEAVRQRWPGKLFFSVGSELTLFSQGMIEGKNVFDRMTRPTFWGDIMAGKHNAPLNGYLQELCRAARKSFHGPLTYFSAPFEVIDWKPFDFVGVDHYRDARIKDSYGQMISKYHVLGKPVIVGEFGCCTFRGADLLGANGFMITFGMLEGLLGPDQKFPKMFTDMAHVAPQADGHYIRDEELQARELIDQLEILDAAGVDGAFVFTFVTPNSPYRPDPRYDTDMANFALVKSFATAETAAVFRSQTVRRGRDVLGVELDPRSLDGFTGPTGQHGVTYPDMPWEPK
ncbi:MAG TPA: hypothetical protein VJR06_07790, partial [Nitrososphaerales archaeon]|nr:hypothetical protein [Nitrososphaerales archaeon]